jgi:hypothetical protein
LFLRLLKFAESIFTLRYQLLLLFFVEFTFELFDIKAQIFGKSWEFVLNKYMQIIYAFMKLFFHLILIESFVFNSKNIQYIVVLSPISNVILMGNRTE